MDKFKIGDRMTEQQLEIELKELVDKWIDTQPDHPSLSNAKLTITWEAWRNASRCDDENCDDDRCESEWDKVTKNFYAE